MKLPRFIERNKVRSVLISVIVVLLIFASLASYFNLFVGADANGIARKFYVAKDGIDAGNTTGDLTHPFATINRAQEVTRTYIASSDFTGANIYIRKGTYDLSSTIQLTNQDSGRNGYKVSYLNYPGEHPVIRGSKTLTGWTAGNSGIVNTDLTSVANNIPADLMVSEVYLNGKKQVLAQEPNVATPNFSLTDPYTPAGSAPGKINWFYASLNGNGYEVTGNVDQTKNGWFCSDNSKMTDTNKQNLVYNSADISATMVSGITSALTQTGNLPKLDVFTQFEIDNSILEIASIDTATTKITTKQKTSKTGETKFVCPKNRYTVKNFLAALDTQNEWYQDKSTGNKLYYKPPTGYSASSDRISIPVLQRAFRFFDGNPHNIKIEGLTFEEFGYRDPVPTSGEAISSGSVGTVISVGNSSNIEISHNIIQNSAAYGIYVSSASNNINIHHNQIAYLTHSGIFVKPYLLGESYNAKLIAENISVTDNTIHDIGLVYNQDVGIYDGLSVGALISHNEIYNTPSSGIRYESNDTLIEQNYVHDTSLITQNQGAIYLSGRLSTRGNVVTNNLIKDTGGYGKFYWYINDGPMKFKHDTIGVYFDFSTGGNTAKNNIVIGATRACLDGFGGSGNTYTNNFCINSGSMNASLGTQVLLSESKGIPTVVSGKNVYPLGSTIGNWQEIQTLFTTGKLDKQKYIDHYASSDPEFVKLINVTTLTNLEGLELGQYMVKNTIEHNVFYYPDVPTTLAYVGNNLGTDQTFDNNLFYAGSGSTRAVNIRRTFPTQGDITHSTWVQWQTDLGFDLNSQVNEDPNFTSVALENFTLASGSPALTLGVEQINITRTGANRVGPRPLEAPVITLVSPADGSTVTTDSVTVLYKVNDENASQTFTGLTVGNNPLTITAANPIDPTNPDLIATRTLNVIYDPLQKPVILILTPPDGTVIHQNFVTVTYTVDGAAKSRTFNDLTEGDNTLSITASNPIDPTLITTVSIVVKYIKLVGPDVVILSPADHFITYDTPVTVTFTIDGVPGSRNFDLTPGENVLTISAANPLDPTLTTTKAVIVIFKESVLLPPDKFGNGWNMVSFPDLAAGVTSKILPSSYKLRQYYTPDKKYIKGELQEITLNQGSGYWMDIDNVNKLSGIKYPKEAKTSAEASVRPGWNLMGNPFSTDLPMNNIIIKYKDGSTKTYADAIKSKKIVGSVRKATEVIGYTWSWNQKDNRWDFIAINPENYKTDANKRTSVEPYRGFWMLIISDQISSIIINK